MLRALCALLSVLPSFCGFVASWSSPRPIVAAITTHNRRDFLRASVAGVAGTLVAVPAAIEKALAIEAHNQTKSIRDVKHIVILMQENRSFDHYFGAMRGVRGFGDRHPIPLASGKPVWFESDGTREITPFRLDGEVMNAALINSTPHNVADSQAAWNQGKFGEWPRWKRPLSMGYYSREEAPFQWALADAFTICDGSHCSIATGTDPNRIIFWSGSNFNPELRAAGINSTDADAEFWNLRCWITGALPTPGYTYRSNPFKWATIPDVLEQAGISWRIYQDPNNNWTGAMHGCLAFESFRTAKPDSRSTGTACRTGRSNISRTTCAAARCRRSAGCCRRKSSRSIPVDRAAPAAVATSLSACWRRSPLIRIRGRKRCSS